MLRSILMLNFAIIASSPIAEHPNAENTKRAIHDERREPNEHHPLNEYMRATKKRLSITEQRQQQQHQKTATAAALRKGAGGKHWMGGKVNTQTRNTRAYRWCARINFLWWCRRARMSGCRVWAWLSVYVCFGSGPNFFICSNYQILIIMRVKCVFCWLCEHKRNKVLTWMENCILHLFYHMVCPHYY